MMLRFTMATMALLAALQAEGVIAKPAVVTQDLSTDYSFEQYVQEFGKTYKSEEERRHRQKIFDFQYQHIREHNAEQAEKGGGHLLGVNEFTDRTIPYELPLGYDKSRHPAWNGGGDWLSFRSRGSQSASQTLAEEQFQSWMDNEVVPVSDLPKEVDWRTKSNPTIVTDVKQQGMCGSCWAFASSEVLESHLALATGQEMTLSPQEFVSCVANPQHCGGSGGCGGATYELAFDFVMEHGIVPDSVFPYKSGSGGNVKCLHEPKKDDQADSFLRKPVHDNNNRKNADNKYFPEAVATIQGYVHLPTNNYTMLMNAVSSLGPIGITAAASRWAFYRGGVFDLPHHNATDATDMNHAIVLVGYGVDQETQEPFWLVRNSWGPHWGEGGYIRLKRNDPSTLPDFNEDDCGIDRTPSDGAACTKDKDGNDIVPPPVRVCGTSGILFDSFVPIGGKLLPTPSQTANTGMGTQTERV